MTITSRQFFAERKRIVELALKYRLPAIYFQKEFVDEGGLMSYGADYEDLFPWSATVRAARPFSCAGGQSDKIRSALWSVPRLC